ncbi:hypothetical protein ACSX1C_09545 [Pseudomonas sp. MBLB4123]|uniref:Uncharacterized protein n=1 Tax=Pseudomonas benzenivorans TaxID=556533 RepID=A0ABZ0PZ05_9PSED|nr:hypothetical protein [Pseudomonas benzenivorans]WPC06376.1 hypothetical protein SBP02_06370 [Pseudomonas benzenivorans]
MAKWMITYSKDEGTGVLEVESTTKPSMEQAVQWLLEMAERDYEREEPKDRPYEVQTPAVRLLERYGITVTSICEE